MNKLKQEKKIKTKKQSKIISSILDVVNGNFLTNESVVGLLPFILFLTMIALVYISNGYYAENKVRAINNMTNELKELRSEYITTKSELMFRSKQSEVASSLEKYGIKESVVPPRKIVVKGN
ncbi:MAG: FtsL-like putative cell division protein [Bacteroidota bacterium]|nr:FtsL-like putative cell division protein [Bacteroidota bacterium]